MCPITTETVPQCHVWCVCVEVVGQMGKCVLPALLLGPAWSQAKRSSKVQEGLQQCLPWAQCMPMPWCVCPVFSHGEERRTEWDRCSVWCGWRMDCSFSTVPLDDMQRRESSCGCEDEAAMCLPLGSPPQLKALPPVLPVCPWEASSKKPE